MKDQQSIAVFELDEDLEICGRRAFPMRQAVIPLASPPKELARIRLQVGPEFNHVNEVEIGWFDAEESPDYVLANKSLWYLSISAELPGTTVEQYDHAWELFRNKGVETLIAMLGLASWGIGRGIAARRGQDLFVVELDGLDNPMWTFFVSLTPSETYQGVLATAKRIDDFFTSQMAPWVKGP